MFMSNNNKSEKHHTSYITSLPLQTTCIINSSFSLQGKSAQELLNIFLMESTSLRATKNAYQLFCMLLWTEIVIEESYFKAIGASVK